MDRELSDIATPQKLARQPSCTHPLPDISILESYPTHEFGFDMGTQHEPDGQRGAMCVDANSEPLTTDQRGKPRPAGAGCDVGAFERQADD